MPRLVDFGAPYGTVSFPDNATDEQIVAEYDSLVSGGSRAPRQADLSVGDYARQIGGSLVRGAADVVASLPEAIDIARKAIPSVLPSPLSDVVRIGTTSPFDIASDLTGGAVPSASRLLRGAASGIRGAAKAVTPAPVPELEESFLASKLPAGIGSALGFIGGGAAGAALKLPRWLSIAGLGSASGGSDFYNDAIQSGADERTAHIASLIGNVVGTSEALPLARIINRLDRISGGGFTKSVINAGKDSLEEAIQEASQQTLKNVTAKTLYDKDRELFQNVAEGAGVGGLTGAILSGVAQLAGIPIRRARMEEGLQKRRDIIRDYAESTRTQTGQPTQTRQVPQMEQGEEGPLQVRGAPSIGLEAETGTPIARLSQRPVAIPIQIQSPDGTIREGEFNGYYDLTSMGRGFVPSIGWNLPNGTKTHGMLKPEEVIVGDVPTPEQWQTTRAMVSAPDQLVPYNAVRHHEITKMATEFNKQYPGSPRVEVVSFESDLPQEVLNSITEDVTGTVSGVVHGDKIWIVSSAINNINEAQRTIAHESIGHAGLRGIMDEKEFSNFVSDVVNKYKGTTQWYELARTYKGDNVIAEEVVARIAENQIQDPTLWQRIVTTIKKWFRKITGGDISDDEIRDVLVRSRRRLREPGLPPVSVFRYSVQPRSPTTFTNLPQVELAVSDPLLTPAQIRIQRDLAKVQSSMVSDNIMGWFLATDVDDADTYAKKILEPIQDRRFISNDQSLLSAMPRSTDDQRQAREVVSAAILNHYGIDRQIERQINTDIEKDVKLMEKAGTKLKTLSTQQMKANFLSALFNRLTTDYRKYLANLTQTAAASGNLQAQYRQQLTNAERRLNEHEVSPTAVQNALQAIAVSIDPQLLQPGTTNQQIIDWTIQNGMLNTVVGDEVKDWLLTDRGNGIPALLGYTRLREDLSDLRDVLQNQQEVTNDIHAFEKWFRPSGKTGKVSVKNFAESYFKFRTARDRAVKVIKAIEKEIGDLDTRIYGNMIARNKLQELMTSPTYRDTVKEAADTAHVVVRALYDSNNVRTGLIGRDKRGGVWTLKGPVSGDTYTVDLHPSSAIEKVNQGNLKGFAKEAREYAEAHSDDDPIVSNSYLELADYIDRFLVHPALNPSSGFTQLSSIRIPRTNIRFGADPINLLPKTIRDTLEKLGGRALRQAILDSFELDTVMKRVDAISNNKNYGIAAQTDAVLNAIESHGWSSDSFAEWDEGVAEKVLASGQNSLSAQLQIGDVIPGSGGAKVTKEDMAAIRLMKQWEDSVLAAFPNNIRDRIADLGITRKAISSGRLTTARTMAQWVQPFLVDWNKATTDAQKIQMLTHPTMFKRIVLGYIHELNPEFSKMNPASDRVSKFYRIFRRMTAKEKAGVQQFNNWDDAVDFVTNEAVSDGMYTDYTTARPEVEKKLIEEITDFMAAFQREMIEGKTENVWGSVPDAIVDAATANNAFTLPRGELHAPSTFYSYSVGSDGAKLNHIGSLRSVMNLKVIQSYREAMSALGAEKARMERKAADFQLSGMSKQEAMNQMIKETEKSRKQSDIRFDYLEIGDALRLLESTFSELERFEKSTHEHFQHAGVVAAMSGFGSLKAMLLSAPQAVVTNYWSGVMLGPAMMHLQTGQIGRALGQFALQPNFFKTMFQRMSAMLAGNPVASKLLKTHAPFWEWMAKGILNSSEDWRRIQQIAELSGMVSPYNLSTTLSNKKRLATTSGRLEQAGVEDQRSHRVIELWNWLTEKTKITAASEGVKAFSPRWFDNWVNYALINAFDSETEMLKQLGWQAFKAREEDAVKTGADWTDLSDAKNILTPGDLRLTRFKFLERYRQLFAGVGSLDQVLLDFYQRTKNMTAEQRKNEPLIESDEEHAALALQYAAITNAATETNRPYLYKGKGSDGVFRNIAGTFMGWSINMLKNLSKEIQTHSKDPQYQNIFGNMLMIGTMVLLFSLTGMWNWEFGDELTEKLFGQSSPRIQPGNVAKGIQQGDYETAFMYFIQSLTNTIPYIGPEIGNILGLAFTGKGNPFDVTSWNPILGFIYDAYKTPKRMWQTGDVVLPLADFTRRWVPLSRIAINRLPNIRGLVDQQNAVRSMNASAPPGTEIKWGRRGASGEVVYGPANDEIQKLISAAYNAVVHGGSVDEVQQKRLDAINAFIRAGRSPQDAKQAVDTALAAKEPVRVLTGKEMTPEEERKWVARMTASQKADYDNAVKAWRLLGSVTGKDLNMVSRPGGGGGGGFGPVGLPSPLGRASGTAAGGYLRPVSFRAPSPSFVSQRPSSLRRIRRTGRTGRSVSRSLKRRPSRIRSPRVTRRRRRISIA